MISGFEKKKGPGNLQASATSETSVPSMTPAVKEQHLVAVVIQLLVRGRRVHAARFRVRSHLIFRLSLAPLLADSLLS